jgi:glycosyltransferase involved in cell wall biosynthesis
MQNNEHILPLVTIGIPTFNRADSYLKDSLKSAVSQTYSNIEIIVSDNASTDNTETLIKSFHDPRIRYIKQSENIGALNNANYCVEQARGEFFLLLHDDDLIDHDFIEVCMKAVNYRTDVGVILTGTRIIDEDGAIIREDTNKAEGLSTADFFMAWFDCKLPLYLCSTIFHAGRLKEIGYSSSKKHLYGDDVVLFQLAAKFGRKDIHDVKASFRKHTINYGLAASIVEWCEDSLYLLNVMCDLSGDSRELVRNRGLIYFCLVNYGYIRERQIRSGTERMRAYWFVYKKFEFAYSPVHYVFGRNIFYRNTYRVLSYLKRKMKAIT